MVETNKPTRVAMRRFLRIFLVNRNHKRLAHGSTKGDISIAPMITAVELTFNPMDATTDSAS
jgi:hypothetical protein